MHRCRICKRWYPEPIDDPDFRDLSPKRYVGEMCGDTTRPGNTDPCSGIVKKVWRRKNPLGIDVLNDYHAWVRAFGGRYSDCGLDEIPGEDPDYGMEDDSTPREEDYL